MEKIRYVSMKYLKKIFESTKYELQEFCEINLAYLLDDSDFIIDVQDDLHGKKFNGIKYIIELNKLGEDSLRFKWEDVNKYMIPFLHFLNREYTIDKNKVYFYFVDHVGNVDRNSFIVSEILSEKSPDKIYFNKELFSILIKIK